MKIKFIVGMICLVLCVSPHVSAKKKNMIEVFGGAMIPGLGLAIDASYDNRLDSFVPGYKVLSVAIVNNSLNIIRLDPRRDKWWVQVKNFKKKYQVVSDLRGDDAAAWQNVPERARGLISYPLALAIGARQVIDLFVPDNVPLEEFNELIIYLSSLDTTIKVIPRQ